MQPDDKLLIYGRIKTVLFPKATDEQHHKRQYFVCSL